jgi:4-diphosphocytidyl-2-C-methyl-D-erythritol kinase
MKIRSFAKINLGIEVLGTRPDGYHDILTLFQSIDLADVLDISELPGGEIALSGDDPEVPWDGTNLIHRAAALLQAETGCPKGARIAVAKSIPAGKGLGGGSSNAAAALTGLNLLWGLGLGREDLSRLGERLGADVPYFLKGGLCLGEGRGDRLTPLPDLPPASVLLAFPPFQVGTAGIYAAWRPSLTRSPTLSPAFQGGDKKRGSGLTPYKSRPSCREVEGLTSEDKPSKIRRFLENRDLGLLENRLEETIFRFHPQLEEYKRFFLSRGAAASLVSGTGSAVFGLFGEKAPALEARRLLRDRVRTALAATLPAKEYARRLRAGV